jgi:hypothetical protein
MTNISFIPLNTQGKLYLGGYNFKNEFLMLEELLAKEISFVFGLGFMEHPLLKYSPNFGVMSVYIDDSPTSCCFLLMDEILNKMLPMVHAYLSSGKNVYIGCHYGISRSACFIISYLIEYHSKSYEEAYEYVKRCREIINPNSAFVKLLKYRESKLLKCRE